MRTLSKIEQQKMTPTMALKLLKEGNTRFLDNLKFNRNLLQQVNETSEGQNPFAVIISCMDSRTSAELVFDQGLGDIFSIRIAGNIITDEIVGSAEFACKVIGAKLVLVLGHTNCGAIKGAFQNVELGSLDKVLGKIRRCIPKEKTNRPTIDARDILLATHLNVLQGIQDLREKSLILSEMENLNEINIVGGLYDVSNGKVEFELVEKNISSMPQKSLGQIVNV